MTLTTQNTSAPTTHLNMSNHYPFTATTPKEQHAAQLVSEVDNLFKQRTSRNQTGLAFYIDLGRQLLQAENLLGQYKFKGAFKRWRTMNIVGFSWTSAYRYMRVARYAKAITAAGITGLIAADHFADQQEHAAWRMEQSLREPASALLLKVNGNECKLFEEVLRLPDDERTSYLKRLAAKLYRVLQQ